MEDDGRAYAWGGPDGKLLCTLVRARVAVIAGFGLRIVGLEPAGGAGTAERFRWQEWWCQTEAPEPEPPRKKGGDHAIL